MLHVSTLCHMDAMVFVSAVRTAPIRFFRVLLLPQLNAKVHLTDLIQTSILLPRAQPVYNIQYDTTLEDGGSMHAGKTGLAKSEIHLEQVDGTV